jgi:hypothetical protein
MVQLQDLTKIAQGTAVAAGIPAPVGGLNYRDSLDNMPVTDALRLDNWYCEANKVVVRPGHASHSTGVGSDSVETIATFEGEATSKLIAMGGAAIYDVTTAGAATELATGFNSDRWQTTEHNNYMILANGNDDIRTFDGTTIAETTFTGVDLGTIADVASFKGRLHCAVNNSASVWYGGVGEVTGGTLTEFDLGQISQHGGTLTAVGVWSRDAGDTLQAVICYVMSSGEIIVYSGSNPSDASDWSLLGQFFIAEPLGRRCLVRLGGELILMCKAGFFPMSLIINGATVDQLRGTPYGKIRDLITAKTAAHGANFGWSGVASTRTNQLIYTVPEGRNFTQLVYNSLTGAWSTYSGLEGRQWVACAGELYFGGPGGVVYKHTGLDDAGSDITVKAKSAWTYFEDRGRKKQATMMRPVIDIDGEWTCKVAMDVDFGDATLTATTTLIADSGGSPWDTSDWDTANWGDGSKPNTSWISASGLGRNFAVRVEGDVSNQKVAWLSTDFLGNMGATV